MPATSFEFVPALPGSWTRAACDLITCNEESAHDVIAVLMGLEIHEARIDTPDVGVPGVVSIAGLATEDITCDEDLDSAYYRRLLAVLAGPVFTRRWPTGTWPLDATDPGDVGFVARLCRMLKYGLVDLFVAGQRVEKLLDEPYVKRALREVGWARLERGAIPGDEVRRLVRAETEAI
jgi:hypothetical protein